MKWEVRADFFNDIGERKVRLKFCWLPALGEDGRVHWLEKAEITCMWTGRRWKNWESSKAEAAALERYKKRIGEVW